MKNKMRFFRFWLVISVIAVTLLFVDGVRASSVKGAVGQPQLSEPNANVPDHWMSDFYLYPTASKTSEMINQMIANKRFSQLASRQAESVVVFFTYLFKRYPGNIKEWVDGVKFDNQRSKIMVYQAVWDSDTAEGRSYLTQVQKKSKSAMARQIQKMFAVAPRDIAKEKVSLDTLDQFWAAYFATGDVQYLRPIVMMAVNPAAKPKANKLIDVARNSVILNGKSHFDLPSVYLAIAAELPSEQKQAVIDIVYKNVSQD